MSGRTFELVSYDSIQLESVRWLLAGRIPLGMVSLVTGTQGDGKSMFTVHLAAQGSRGLIRGDLYGTPVSTLFLTAEDTPSQVIKPRLRAAQADMRLVHNVSVKTGDDPDAMVLPRDSSELRGLIDQAGARLVVIDPLTSFMSEGVNSWKDADVRRVLGPLGRVAEETDCAILVIVHPNKGSGTDALQRISGAGAFTQATRSILTLGRDPGDPDSSRRLLAHAKCNVAPIQATLEYEIQPVVIGAEGGEPQVETASMVEVGESTLRSDDLFTRRDADERTQTDDAEDLLIGELEAGPRLAADVEAMAKERGIDGKPLRSARERLGVTTKGGGIFREEFGGASYWRLPGASMGGGASMDDGGGAARPMPERLRS